MHTTAIEDYIKLLKTARHSCVNSSGSPCITGRFQEMLSVISEQSIFFQRTQGKHKQLLKRLRLYLDFAESDWRNLFKICALIDYLERQRFDDNPITGYDQFLASSLEICIHSFHTEVRSIADYIAAVVCVLYDMPFNPNNISFRPLLESINNGSSTIGRETMKHTFLDYEIFYSGNTKFRNNLVHKGADAFVDLRSRRLNWRVGFQVFGGQLSPDDFDFPHELFRAGLVDLNIYIGLSLARVITFLNRLAEDILEVLKERNIIVLERLVEPSYPSTIVHLLDAGYSPTDALRVMNSTSNPIRLRNSIETEVFVVGSPSADIFMEEAEVALGNFFFRALYS